MENQNDPGFLAPPLSLSPVLATRMAKLALSGIEQAYPNVLERFTHQVYQPRQLHPAFYGCYDWHSAVHSHWMLVRLLRTIPQWSEAETVRAVLDKHLTAENLQAELANFGSPTTGTKSAALANQTSANVPIGALYSLPGQNGFERPYGWAWLLQLVAELSDWNDPQGQRWFQYLQPLASKMVELFTDYLENHTQYNLVPLPQREGLHTNTAFGLGLALDYARKCDQTTFERLLVERGQALFQSDKAAPIQQEPGPTDFLSPALIEADFMSRVLPTQPFAFWFSQFLPTLLPATENSQPATLLQPVFVSDHNDPFICHLDGLNLSRAWCLYRIANKLPIALPVRNILLESARAHSQEGLDHIFEGNFQSTGHWLCTFAVYLLTLPPAP